MGVTAQRRKMAGGTTATEADWLVVLAGTKDIERGVSFSGDDVHPIRTGAQLIGEACEPRCSRRPRSGCSSQRVDDLHNAPTNENSPVLTTSNLVQITHFN